MDNLHFSIVINASREKVWKTLLEKETYQLWTDVFAKGSHYIGDWNKGSKILFLAPDSSGKMAGMVSRIKENILYEVISIEHLGVVNDGIEDTASDEVSIWSGSLENYTLKDIDGKTEVLVDMDSNEDYKDMFQNMWPEALQKLKELSEK